MWAGQLFFSAKFKPIIESPLQVISRIFNGEADEEASEEEKKSLKLQFFCNYPCAAAWKFCRMQSFFILFAQLILKAFFFSYASSILDRIWLYCMVKKSFKWQFTMMMIKWRLCPRRQACIQSLA